MARFCGSPATGIATHRGSAADPWSAGPIADAAPETQADRQKRVDVALERVSRLKPKLAHIRELAFDHDIERAYQTPAALRAFARAQIEKEMSAAIAVDHSAALFHIGLLLKSENLAALEERAFTSQGGSYYDVTTKQFFLISAPDNDMLLDAFSVHELTHALQDQHFDLEKILPDGATIDADHLSAHPSVHVRTMFVTRSDRSALTARSSAIRRGLLALRLASHADQRVAQHELDLGVERAQVV